MDPSNSLDYRQYFQYYDRSSTQQLQHPINENFGAFLWSLPTSTGFNLQHKNSIVILPFYINSLIRVVCQLSSVDISASTVLLTSSRVSSEFKPI